MKQIQRVISFLLALVLMVGMVPPIAVRAEETEPTQTAAEAVVETTAPTETVTEPVAETTAPTEASTEPVEETTVPTEATTEPVEETTVPTEAVTEPVEETTAPTEAVTEPTVDTRVPTEKETAGAQTMADAVAASTVASGTCGENLTWTLDDAGTLIISGTGPMEEFYEPPLWIEDTTSVIVEEGVTSISASAFAGCTSLTNVTILGATSIGSGAFASCKNLLSVMLSEGITSIGWIAFSGCTSLTAITIPKSVTSIAEFTFEGCTSLTNVTILGATSIGEGAFLECENLLSVMLPEGMTSIGGDAFSGCTSLTAITFPKSLTSIGGLAFEYCASLTSITIPKSVTSIGQYAFADCTSLNSIYFEGDAPIEDDRLTIGDGIFEDVTATAYYPANNPTWTEDVLQDYGGTITWVPYTPDGSGDADVDEKPCRLNKLSDVDYLAFSAIAYLPFGQKGTVKENMIANGYWEKTWSEDQDITYAELCEHIASWKVVTLHDLSNYNGFYALAFRNDDDEIVISYRGSEPPANFKTRDWDVFCDWMLNDFPIVLGNKMGIQLDDALEIYDNLALNRDKSQIAVTGHSLGGAWADAVSAYSGCEGVTFNAAPILDVLYKTEPELMAEMFHGVDKWNFVDHANENDFFVGMFEKHMSTRLKPYVSHESNIPISVSVREIIDAIFEDVADDIGKTILTGAESALKDGVLGFVLKSVAGKIAKATMGDIVACHGLDSIVVKTSDGKLSLTSRTGTFTPSKKVTNYMLTANHSVDLGSSGTDIISEAKTILVPRTSFGGDSDDRINTSWRKDHIIGGGGKVDALDGSWNDDTYIYYLGDGYDVISDISGNDVLKLCGINGSDVDIELSDDGQFVEIYHNGECIVSIRSKNRAEGSDLFTIEYGNGAVSNINSYLNTAKYSSAMRIGCPVNIEILDSEGKVVYTLNDGEVGNYYTDYGNFYIFEGKNGEYGKSLDLLEGYTARIVGHDAGTMKIEHCAVTGGKLSQKIKTFVDVPVSDRFTATFEETEDGELVLAADTDGDGVVDAKIGYDGKPVPADAVQIDREYVALKPGEMVQLTAKAQPAELTELIQWRMEKDDETVASVDQKGLVTANSIGTAYVIASVTDGETTATARCRIDVAETEEPEDGDGSGEEIEPVIKIDGIQLSTTKVTSELYSSDYAQFDLLLKLPQNISIMSTEDRPISESKGVAIEEAWFVESGAKAAFNLLPLDDRRIALVPTEEALENPSGLAKSYKSQVTVVVDGWEYTTVEEMSITLKQSKPKLKATVPAFNAFYTGQTQQITITGGTVTDIAGKEIPEWLTLNSDGALSLNEKAGTKNSGKAVLLVDTEEWIIPAEVSLSVKNAYKVPGLKLSASSVKMAANAADSSGVALKLLPKSKKDTLAGLNVRGIAVADEFKYNIEDFNPETGAFILKAENGFQTGTIVLNVSFSDTQELLQLKLKVTTQTVSLKLSPTTVTLNKRTGDQAQIKITAAPADYKLTALDVKGNEAGELEIAYENGILTVGTKEETKAQTYALSVSAGGSRAVTLKIKVTEELPVVTLKAKSGIDLSFPDRMVSVVPTFKNYAGGEIEDYTAAVIAPDGTATDAFDVSYEDGAFLVKCRDTEIVTGTYRLKLTLQLNNNVTLEANTKLGVKRTAVKLKLTPSKLTLNKAVNDQGSIAVSCTTKGYDFREQPAWALKTKNKKDSAEGKLDIKWEENKLQIAVNAATEPGATYNLQVKANKHAPAVNLAIKIVDVIPTVSLKASGTVDVIRNGTSILVTPSYRNCMDLEKRENLNVYSSADRFTEPVEGLFHMDRDDLGRFVLTAAPGLDHTKSYKVELESTVGGISVKSAKIPVKVKMGSAKLILNADGNVMFGNDCNDRINFRIATRDNALNGVEKVVSKDARFEVVTYENGEFALAFRDGTVNRNLPGKSATVSLDVFLKGNETVTAEKAKPNTTLKLKVSIVK